MAKEKARNNAQSEIAKAMQVVDHEKRGLYDPRFEHDNVVSVQSSILKVIRRMIPFREHWTL